MLFLREIIHQSITQHWSKNIQSVQEAIDKPAISEIIWDGVPDISDPATVTLFAKEIFKHSVLWMNKQTLHKALNEFAFKAGFTATTINGSCFGWNRAGNPHMRTKSGEPQQTSAGALQVKCAWSFWFASVTKVYIINLSGTAGMQLACHALRLLFFNEWVIY